MILLAALLAMTAPPFKPSQPQLDAISDHCSAPRQWLRVDHEHTRIQPSADADFGKLDCVLKALRQAHVGNLGFVGNERYR